MMGSQGAPPMMGGAPPGQLFPIGDANGGPPGGNALFPIGALHKMERGAIHKLCERLVGRFEQ